MDRTFVYRRPLFLCDSGLRRARRDKQNNEKFAEKKRKKDFDCGGYNGWQDMVS